MNNPEQMIIDFLDYIKEDKNREGLMDTPKRVVKSWGELYSGYKEDPEQILSKTFDSNIDEMVGCYNIDFYSMCEHHTLTFNGKAHIAYIPNGKVVGISKLVRLVECFGRRLQIQENMTMQIADSIMKYLKPDGVGVVIEAQHLCMKSRGVRNSSSVMVTQALLGSFKNMATREEFLKIIQLEKNK